MRPALWLTAVFVFMISTCLSAQEETLRARVGVVPMINTQDDAQYDPVCWTIDDTVRLNIDLLDRYRVVITDRFNPYESKAALKTYAAENRLDNLVFGRLSLGKNKEIVLQMSVYDRVKDSVTITKEKRVKDLFHIFDASSALVEDLVREFSGMHVGYGVLRLRNRGEEGDFSVYVDGQYGGDSVFDLHGVLNGKRLIEIRQERMLGPTTIHSEELLIYEDKVTDMDFSIPYLLPGERAELERLEKIIAASENRKDEKQRVVESFRTLLGYFDDVSYCPGLVNEREKYRQMEVMYRLNLNRWNIEDGFEDPGQDLFDELLAIHESAGGYLEPGRIRMKATENASFLYNVLGVNAARDLSNGKVEKGLETYDRIASMGALIPITHYHLFEDERSFVRRNEEERRDRSFLARILTGLGDKKRIERYFGTRLKSADELFRGYSNVSDKELIVLTDPSGMEVYAGGEKVGRSPVRIRNLKTDRLQVRVADRWFRSESSTVSLTADRNFVFLSSAVTARIEGSRAENTGQGSFELSWKELPETKTYRVEVVPPDGDFSQPLFEKKGIRETGFAFKEDLQQGPAYRFRVQAVSRDGLRSVWSYGDGPENRVRWSSKTGGVIASSPAAGGDGTLFFGSGDRGLYAVDGEGNILWVFPTGGGVSGSPLVGPGGTVYFGSGDGVIYALSSAERPAGSAAGKPAGGKPAGQHGGPLWSLPTGGSIQAAPVLGENGVLYAGCTDGLVYAVEAQNTGVKDMDAHGTKAAGMDAAGTLKWVFRTGGPVVGSPSLGAGEVLYVGSTDHSLYALGGDGTLKWVFRSGGPIGTTPAVGSDGMVYFGSDDFSMYALDSGGKLRWVFPTGGKIRSSPVLGPEGTLYFGSDDGCLYAVRSDGSPVWIFGARSPVQTSPCLGSDGTVYFADTANTVYALDAEGGLKWKYRFRSPITSAPSRSGSGEILIGSGDWSLYALVP